MSPFRLSAAASGRVIKKNTEGNAQTLVEVAKKFPRKTVVTLTLDDLRALFAIKRDARERGRIGATLQYQALGPQGKRTHSENWSKIELFGEAILPKGNALFFTPMEMSMLKELADRANVDQEKPSETSALVGNCHYGKSVKKRERLPTDNISTEALAPVDELLSSNEKKKGSFGLSSFRFNLDDGDHIGVKCDVCQRRVSNLDRHLDDMQEKCAEHAAYLTDIFPPVEEAFDEVPVEENVGAVAARSNTDEYETCFCGRSFENADALKQHQLYIHEGDRPWDCPYCHKQISSYTNLRKHVNFSCSAVQRKPGEAFLPAQLMPRKRYF